MPCFFPVLPTVHIKIGVVEFDIPDLLGVPAWLIQSFASMLSCFFTSMFEGIAAGLQWLASGILSVLAAVVTAIRAFFILLFGTFAQVFQGLGVAAPLALALGVVVGMVLFGLTVVVLVWVLARVYELL